jgi:hypothetical protein
MVHSAADDNAFGKLCDQDTGGRRSKMESLRSPCVDFLSRKTRHLEYEELEVSVCGNFMQMAEYILSRSGVEDFGFFVQLARQVWFRRNK